MLDDTLTLALEKQVRAAVEQSIQVFVERVISEMSLDQTWLTKVENFINQSFAHRFDREISKIDVNELIVKHIDQGIERWQHRLLKDFRTNGILDHASNTQITMTDETTVVANQLVAKKLISETDAKINGTLILNNLSVTGKINTDNASWNELSDTITAKTVASMTEQWQKDLVQQVLDVARTQGISFDEIVISGEPLVIGDTLNRNIRNTSIETTGELQHLRVRGDCNFGTTVRISNNRVGINTETPEMALSIWDEEISLLAGKVSNQRAYLGTGRLQALTIGVNRQAHIEIDVEGVTTINQLRLNRYRIGHAAEVPGYSGTKGDIIFNSDPQPGAPFGWQCLGAYRWQPLRTS